MAIIYTYPSGAVKADDLIIVSEQDTAGSPTKNITVSDLANFITTTGTGTGTTDYIVKWNDGPGGIIGDSLMIERIAAGVFPGNYIEVSGTGGVSTQNLEVNADLFDSVGAPGAAGQVLSSLGAGNGIQWVAGGGIPWPYQYDAGNGLMIQGENPGTTGTNTVSLGVGALASITSGTQNTAIGYNALSAETVGNNTTAIGFRALENQVGSANAYNVAVGGNAGRSVTSGEYNVLVGDGAGLNLTIGSQNVAIGQEALAFQVDYGQNTAVGHKALQLTNTTDPAYNTGLGFSAGNANTTGRYNTFVGANAASQIAVGLTGENNTIIGYNAGANMEGVANENVWIGSGAAEQVSTGTSSVIIGFGAGNAITGNHTTGSTIIGCLAGQSARQFSTLVGLRAGFNITVNGEDNVCVGAYAGDAITDGNLNVMMGHSADIGTNTDNNSIAIGGNAIGAGSNTVVLGNTNTTSWQPGADDTVSLGDKPTRGFKELILVSPDGTRWSVTVDNGGNLVVA